MHEKRALILCGKQKQTDYKAEQLVGRDGVGWGGTCVKGSVRSYHVFEKLRYIRLKMFFCHYFV